MILNLSHLNFPSLFFSLVAVYLGDLLQYFYINDFHSFEFLLFSSQKKDLRVIVGSQLQCMLGNKQRLMATMESSEGPVYKKNGSNGLVLHFPRRWFERRFLVSYANFHHVELVISELIHTWRSPLTLPMLGLVSSKDVQGCKDASTRMQKSLKTI